MEISLPIFYWGGEPIRTLSETSEIHREDFRILQRWSNFLCDSGKADDDWIADLESGRTWVDVPSADGKRRLFLKPFYKSSPPNRGLWFFFGCAVDQTAVTPGMWASLLRRLTKLDRGAVEQMGSIATFSNMEEWSARSDCESQESIFRGPYADAFSRLCSALAAKDWKTISPLHIASHPPSGHPEFTMLILADDFCYNGIRLAERNSAEIPKAPKHEPVIRRNAAIGPPPKSFPASSAAKMAKRLFVRPPWWVSGVLGAACFICFMIGYRAGVLRETRTVQTKARQDGIEEGHASGWQQGYGAGLTAGKIKGHQDALGEEQARRPPHSSDKIPPDTNSDGSEQSNKSKVHEGREQGGAAVHPPSG